MQFQRDCERIHARYPEQLENLSSTSLFAELQPLIDKLLAEQKPNERWEDKRRIRMKPGDVGLIEREFGSGAEEQRRQPTALPYEPTCLDNIFAGGVVRMRSEDVP